MYRIVCLGSLWYATKIKSVEDDIDNIELFIDEGNIVILAYDIKKVERTIKTTIEVVSG